MNRVRTPSSPVIERERERERERLNFYACKGGQTLFAGQRERGRERKRKREGERERERERE